MLAPLTYDHFEIQTDGSGNPVELGPAGGRTYRAYDKRLRKSVALKIIDQRLVADEQSRRRFFKEAQAAAAIEHPNVARVTYLCTEDAEECFYAMELVEGETLAERIAARGKMSPEQALQTLRPLADALIVLGRSGLAHGDLQPEKVMLTADPDGLETVKLISLGLASGATSEAPVDSRGDFYALGVMLWHLIAGVPPFAGAGAEANGAHADRELPWSELPRLRQPALTLLRRLLAADPEQRPASAREVVELWDAALEGSKKKERAESSPAKSTASATESESAMGDEALALMAAKPPLRLERLAVPPPGCAFPPPVGYLAKGEPGERGFFVRVLPERLPPEEKSQLLAQARKLLAAPHSTLLNVCEVREREIVSEWQRGVMAARLLSSQRGGELPVAIVNEWLPAVAQAVDYAREHRIRRIGLAPSSWLVEFLEGGPGEAPAERATRPPEEWGRQRVWLDPLAGFDALFIAANADASHTMLPATSEPLTTSASYLAALGRAVHELLGGASQSRVAPLPALDEAHNALLLDAIHRRSAFRTAREWMLAFTGRDEGPKPPASLLAKQVTASATTPETSDPPVVPPAERPLRTVAPPARPKPVTAPPRVPLPPAAPPRRSPASAAAGMLAKPAVRRGALALGILLLAMLSMMVIGSFGKRGATTTAPVDQLAVRAKELIAEGQRALTSGDVEVADRKLNAAAELKPNEPGLAPLRQGVQQKRAEAVKAAAVAQSATAGIAARALPATPQSRIEQASKEAPFVNSLGMKFVPVPIAGGRSSGKLVLFSVYETRLGDFERFADSGKYQAPAFQTSTEHPAVRVRPIDAVTFCLWLTERELKAQGLPTGYHYQIPTDHEWSCAAGIGELENAEAPALQKVNPGFAASQPALAFPWGPWPPLRSGNFADALGRNRGLTQAIAGYDDGFPFTAPVGQYPPNAFGLHDLAGNAAEICEDYHEGEPPEYVLRGGSWASVKTELQTWARSMPDLAKGNEQVGFRVVLVALKPHAYPRE